LVGHEASCALKLAATTATLLFFRAPLKFLDSHGLLHLHARAVLYGAHVWCAMKLAFATPRMLEDALPSADLRVLAFLYSEDHTAPLIDLLEASGSSRESPISLIVLHLTELVGRAASILKPHWKSSSTSNPTHHDYARWRTASRLISSCIPATLPQVLHHRQQRHPLRQPARQVSFFLQQ
jgi:hypothetical protein